MSDDAVSKSEFEDYKAQVESTVRRLERRIRALEDKPQGPALKAAGTHGRGRDKLKSKP